jgi:hypothetical protein
MGSIIKSNKGKAIPLQALTGPEGSRRLRLPDLRQSAHEGGKVVSPTHWPPLPQEIFLYSFLLIRHVMEEPHTLRHAMEKVLELTCIVTSVVFR